MKIIEINIVRYGKFKDRSFTLEDGLNVVHGDNESGKSTLLGFIRFILYGVGRKNPNVTVGDRERALTWNEGIAAGSLTVQDTSGALYRIERNGREGARGAFNEKAKIVDLSNGNEVFSGEVPGEHFLGIPVQAYDSMCNIKQLEAVAVGADAVKGVIDSLLSSGDESTSVQAAVKMLDAERRRILHANGRGGLLYENELALDRLKSDHRGAVIFENECTKNLDELEKVEMSLKKARAEFEVAQRMCDVHDDVLRLQRFDELRGLKAEEERIKEKSREFDEGAGFDTSIADLGIVAKLEARADALDKSTESVNIAQIELERVCGELADIDIPNESGFSSIIEEFNSPESAMSHLVAKKKKKADSSVWLVICGVLSAALLAFAAVLVLAMNNFAGAATVAFIAMIFVAIAVTSYKKYSFAVAEISSFVKKMGEGFCPKNEEKIRLALEDFCKNKSDRSAKLSLKNTAEMRLSMLREAYERELLDALALARTVGVDVPPESLSDEFISLARKIREYLPHREELNANLNQIRARVSALTGELERFSEKDIRERITPAMREKVNTSSFEKLKSERDAALYKTNQFAQYKAGIERNIAASSTRKSSAELYPEIEQQTERVEELRLRLDAVRLAMESIENASRSLKSDISPKIRERAQKNLSIMTSGKYNELLIDDDMGLSVFAEGGTRPIDSLSKGSLDVAYISVRLALMQTLLADKNPPLYMDEILSQLDDGRAKNVLCAIVEHARGAQCVLFTCQKRDVELAQSLTDINLIKL